MKKLLPSLFAIALCGAMLFGAVACGENSGQPSPGHTHTFEEKWSYDATEHWHAATCGDSERANVGKHTPDGNGKCTVCGYRTKSITLAEFVTQYQQKGVDFVHNAVKDQVKKTPVSEFIWFKANDKDELISYTYVYTAEKSDTAKTDKTHMVYIMHGTDIGTVDLDDIADGTASATSLSTPVAGFPFDLAEQAAKRPLADALYTACVSFGANEHTPALRLFNSNGYKDGKHELAIMDVYDGGYLRYTLYVEAAEDADDAALIEALQDGSKLSGYKESTVSNQGTKLYFNVAQ